MSLTTKQAGTEPYVSSVMVARNPLLTGEDPDSLLGLFERSLHVSEKQESIKRLAPLPDRETIERNIAKRTLTEAFAANHFSPELANRPEVMALVKEYGLAEVCQVTAEIGRQVHDKLRSDETIFRGLEILQDALDQGHAFRGIPVITSNANGEENDLQIYWMDESEKAHLIPIGDTGLYSTTKEIAKKYLAAEKRDSFSSYEEMAETFSYLKSNIPTDLKSDGCDMRCYYISFLLEGV